MRRVGTPELIASGIPKEGDVWVDHVMYDIPETMHAAIRNAAPNIKRFTVHEHIVMMRVTYAEFFAEAKRRDIEICVALADSFDRVPLGRGRR